MGPGKASGAAAGLCLQSCASLWGSVVVATSVSAEGWLRERQHRSVFSSGEFGQGRYISNEETQWGYLPSRACFGAVWSDSKGRGWGGQHLSGSPARRCFEAGVPWCVPFSVSQSSPQLPTASLSCPSGCGSSEQLVSFPAAVGQGPCLARR